MINYDTIKELAKDTDGITIADLCALAPKNDPFYTGRPSELTAATWFSTLWQRFGYGRGVHLRRMHYQIVSQDPPLNRPDGKLYENSQRDWDYLNEASKWARYLGLVSPGAFVDRRNPEAVLNANWQKPGDFFYQDPTPRYSVTDPLEEDDMFLPPLPTLDDLPSDLPGLPDFLIEGYRGIQQNFHLEVWVEKTTMNDVLGPLCRRFGVNLITGAGEMSITSVVEFLQRVRRAERSARIIYISDFDPAGLGMPISVARKVEYFQRNEGHADLDIRLNPIALTADQVALFNLPRVPVKDSDLRKANFEAAHGQGQVELDALEALYPGQLARIVEQAILIYYDPTLENRAIDRRDQLIQDLDTERDRVLAAHENDLEILREDYSDLLDDFSQTQARFNDLVSDFQAEIDQYQDRLVDIKERLQEAYGLLSSDLEAVEIDLDDYPLPDPDLPDEAGDLLYDSRRDYFAQLEAYKGHRFGTNGNGHDHL